MSHIKTADEILKEMHECDNPVTVSSLKTIAISKLKQEREKYRKALDDIAKQYHDDVYLLGIIKEALK